MPNSNSLKVAFLTKWDPLDPHAWSGIMKSMHSSLSRRGIDVTPLGPVRSAARMTLGCGDRLTRKLIGKGYDYRHSLLAAWEYARRFEHKLAAGKFDLIFAPVASGEISLLKTELPIVYLTDILFADYQDYYPQSSHLFGFSVAEADRIEHLAMKKASAFIFPSEWVKERAVKSYAISEERIHVLPFGANLDWTPSLEEATRKRDLDVCRLLFLGVDWERKGGSTAVAVLRLLVDAGIPVQLTVCGCVPPDGVSHPNMEVIPFLSKRDPAQAARLMQLLEHSTFLFLPTMAEAFGIVFCEASAFGLPSITRNTGGVGAVVEDGVNGYKMAPDEGPEAYAQIILDLYKDPERYHSLCASARQAYDQRLNWDAWGHGAQRVLEGIVN